MGKTVTDILTEVYDTINEAVSNSSCSEVLWEDNIKYTTDGVFVSVKRNFKVIVSVHDSLGDDEANEIKQAIENTLNAPENLIGGNGKDKKPHPYKLSIKVIHVKGDINLSKQKIAVSIKQDKKCLLDNCKNFYRPKIDECERKLKGEEASLELQEAENKNPNIISITKRNIESYKRDLSVLKKDYERDIALIKQLSDDGRYKISYYKPNAKLYQMTYFDDRREGRCRAAVGDIVIAIGAEAVDESQRYRRTRSDSYEKAPGVIPNLQCFKVYEDKSPAKPEE